MVPGLDGNIGLVDGTSLESHCMSNRSGFLHHARVGRMIRVLRKVPAIHREC